MCCSKKGFCSPAKTKSVLSGLLVIFFILCPPALACTAIDDTGKILQLPKPAERIVSLAPDITETLFAIGAGNNIVGVMSGSDYPLAANSIQKVGSYAGLDLERIIALQPDLIITWSDNFPRELAVLKKLNIPVYQNNPKKLNDIAHAMRNFGCLSGHEQQANKNAKEYADKLANLQKRSQQLKVIKVFYQISGGTLMTVNQNSWINQAIEICGGHNIFANAKMTAPEVDIEAVISANPDVIIAADINNQWQQRWQRYKNISAVQQQHFITLNPDLIDRPGPRLVEGVKQLCDRFYEF
jgi:iron complex transport system substrate-binding protein